MRRTRRILTELAALLCIGAAEPPIYQQDIDGFIAAKGERALVMGYPEGLELWAYPFQLARDYRMRFRVAGTVEPLDARALLRRVERRADEVVRTYVGPDFVVREYLFVPRTRAGAILRYEVEGSAKVAIEAGFVPVLDLMWPGGIGGQEARWDAARGGYVLRETLKRFAATIASPETVEHDLTANRARGRSERLHLVLAPRNGSATIYFALDPDAATDGAAALRENEAAARADSVEHITQVADLAMEIETPDPNVNRALASAPIALDRAWACSDKLGCGTLAGFGPSRPGRRPQYAWFFAGDGLVAMRGMLAAGQYERARSELDFVTRWQDPKTGMLWHEMSQSAAFIDWSSYPYMYVHVDITLQYLAAVAHYVDVTGDVGFARTHWSQIQHAWRYAMTLVDRVTGLPRIPPGRQGQNEQDDLADDLGLSRAFIAAGESYAELAQTVGRLGVATAARSVARRARERAAVGVWDEASSFPISGHRRDGSTVPDARAGGALSVIGSGILTPEREARVLDRVAGPDFVTDWGLRSLAASDPRYDPNLYSSGSVWALGTAEAATTYWGAHRPLTAWALWRGLANWNTLDSAGNMHEVLAGDLYHPEFESVPEQTWSSAAFLSAGVEAMLGLEPHPAQRMLGFSPHLPAEWSSLTIRKLRVGEARVTLRLARASDALTLEIDNPGLPIAIDFSPQLPLGATLRTATVDGRPSAVLLEQHDYDRHARVRVTAATGTTAVQISIADGILVMPMTSKAELGQRSRNPILANARLADDVLVLEGWVAGPAHAGVVVCSEREATGAAIAAVPTGKGCSQVTLTPRSEPGDDGYAPAKALIQLGHAAEKHGSLHR